MKTKIYNTIIILTIICAASFASVAQDIENEFQSRTLAEISYKPIKKIKLTFSPEFRFDNDFSLDKYILNGEVDYKALKYLTLGARYGLVGNIRNSKDTEYFSKYAFSATVKKEFNRFEPSFRLMYSNYADDDVTDKNFLRYKASVKYDIPDCKITPYAAVQFFQDLSETGLYKTRYAVGADYKLFKKNYLGISYKFDYYNKEYLNKHIISLGYKFKF